MQTERNALAEQREQIARYLEQRAVEVVVEALPNAESARARYTTAYIRTLYNEGALDKTVAALLKAADAIRTNQF